MNNNMATTQMVEMLTTVAKLPEPMQALAMGYAKGLSDAAKLHSEDQEKNNKSA